MMSTQQQKKPPPCPVCGHHGHWDETVRYVHYELRLRMPEYRRKVRTGEAPYLNAEVRC